MFGRKKEHAHTLKCVGVDHETLPGNPLHPGGQFTHALMRCDQCGSIASHTLRGRFTVDQINGVTPAAAAQALIDSSKVAQ